jgi:iron(III) transport system substrate-binding protein
MRVHVMLSLVSFGLACALGTTEPASAQNLPETTKAFLQELKMNPSVLDGLDAELALPADWVDKAKKEGKLRVHGTWDVAEYNAYSKPFRERFPFIELTYARSTRQDRSLKPLAALREGRVLVDVISGLGSNVYAFRAQDALMKLDDLPGFKATLDDLKDPDGLWVGHQINYWCTSYNTKKVKVEDLPKEWEGFLDGSKWGKGRIGLGNRPNLWLLPLADVKGQEWAEKYARGLFANKPQLRKEGMNAMINLVIVGEIDVALPSAQYRLGELKAKGAPIAWYCPDPVPTAVQIVGAVKQTPSPYAAKIYINWLLSREGQLAQFAAMEGAPSHAALQSPDFITFADQLVGKEKAFRSPNMVEEEWPELLANWDKIWQGSGGTAR